MARQRCLSTRSSPVCAYTAPSLTANVQVVLSGNICRCLRTLHPPLPQLISHNSLEALRHHPFPCRDDQHSVLRDHDLSPHQAILRLEPEVRPFHLNFGAPLYPAQFTQKHEDDGMSPSNHFSRSHADLSQALCQFAWDASLS